MHSAGQESYNRPMSIVRLVIASLPILLVCTLPSVSAAAEQKETAEQPAGVNTEYRLRVRPLPKESLFNITFGSPPPLATERGILVIDAYHDRNGNSKHDPDEAELKDDIVCRVGQIDYPVPAFVPGLGYNETYAIACRGKDFEPHFDEPDVFIGKRGQVITVDLACVPAPQETQSSPAPSPAPEPTPPK